MSSDLDLLSCRVQLLERENLRLKRVGMILIVAIGALLVMGQSPLRRTVEAENFVLKGPDGDTRAKLFTKDGSTEFQFYNRAGESRVAIKSDGDGEALEMRDDSGELRATMAVAVQKSPKASSTSTIAVLGRLSGPGVIMQAWEESTILRISDKGGHRVWAVPPQP